MNFHDYPLPELDTLSEASYSEPLTLQRGMVLAIDKPLGWTSFQALKKLRSAMAARLRKEGRIKKLKVGHAGTLDPLATGVLLVCTGRVTSTIDTLQAGEKEYVATIALGATTPSFDRETPVDATYPTDHITRELLDQVLPQFVGAILQVPPAFSACKIKGDRAYDLARKGQEVEIKAKPLVIREIEVLQFSPTEVKLRIVCSKGTYIRALARDLGTALGSGAHLAALRRTRVGDYSVYKTLTMPQALQLIYRSPIEIISDDPQQPPFISYPQPRDAHPSTPQQ